MSVKNKKSLSFKNKKALDELDKLELIIEKLGNMETMRLLGYVSVMPIYSWRKSKKIPHWAKEKINILFKEKKIESNQR